MFHNKLTEEISKAIKRSPAMQVFHQKLSLSVVSQQLWQTNLGSCKFQPSWDSWQSGVKDSPLVRYLAIEVTSQGASSSGIPPQGASSSSKPMEGASISGIPKQGASSSNKPMEGACSTGTPPQGASSSNKPMV
jgi:hypothetical protein